MKKDVTLNKNVTTGTKLYTAVRLFTISKKYPESEWQKTVCFLTSVLES